MADLNSITLVGRATKDADLRTTKDGKNITTVSMANNGYGDRVSYFDIIFFDKTAETAAKYIQKGKQFAVTGELQQRKWEDKDGNNRYSVEIIGRQMQLLGGVGSAREDRPMTQAQALNNGRDFAPEDIEDKEIDLSSIPFS